jgi:hypothetical protein
LAWVNYPTKGGCEQTESDSFLGKYGKKELDCAAAANGEDMAEILGRTANSSEGSCQQLETSGH